MGEGSAQPGFEAALSAARQAITSQQEEAALSALEGQAAADEQQRRDQAGRAAAWQATYEFAHWVAARGYLGMKAYPFGRWVTDTRWETHGFFRGWCLDIRRGGPEFVLESDDTWPNFYLCVEDWNPYTPWQSATRTLVGDRLHPVLRYDPSRFAYDNRMGRFAGFEVQPIPPSGYPEALGRLAASLEHGSSA